MAIERKITRVKKCLGNKLETFEHDIDRILNLLSENLNEMTELLAFLNKEDKKRTRKLKKLSK